MTIESYAAAKITQVESLPDWFDLKKYQGAKSFGAKEWYEQLAYRKWMLSGNPEYPDRQAVTRFIFKEITYKDETGEIVPDGALLYSGKVTIDHADAMSDWQEGVGKAAFGLRANPLAVEQWDDEYLKKAQPVASMTISDLRAVVRQGVLSARRSGTPTLQDYINTFEFENLPEGVRNKSIEHHSIAQESITRAAVMVNLDASNAEITRAFAAWLKEIRACKKPGAKSSRPLYDRWAGYGLLPYLDLKIWAMETDSHIPRHVMSSDVAGYNKGESTFSKTVPPLAANLMRDLSELQALAAVEAAV